MKGFFAIVKEVTKAMIMINVLCMIGGLVMLFTGVEFTWTMTGIMFAAAILTLIGVNHMSELTDK